MVILQVYIKLWFIREKIFEFSTFSPSKIWLSIYALQQNRCCILAEICTGYFEQPKSGKITWGKYYSISETFNVSFLLVAKKINLVVAKRLDSFMCNWQCLYHNRYTLLEFYKKNNLQENWFLFNANIG